MKAKSGASNLLGSITVLLVLIFGWELLSRIVTAKGSYGEPLVRAGAICSAILCCGCRIIGMAGSGFQPPRRAVRRHTPLRFSPSGPRRLSLSSGSSLA